MELQMIALLASKIQKESNESLGRIYDAIA